MDSALSKISHKFRGLDDWHHINKFSLVLIIAIFAAIPLTVFGATAIRQVDPQAFYNPRCSLYKYGSSTPVVKDTVFKSGDKAYINYSDFVEGGKARLRDRLYGGVHQELGITERKLFETGKITFTFKTGLPNGAYSVVINPANATSTNIKCADIKIQAVVADTTPPEKPIVTASNITNSSITWTWSATDNVGVVSYSRRTGDPVTKTYKDVIPGSPTGGASSGGTAPADNQTSVTYTGLLDSTEYFIGVTAYDAAGNRSIERVVTAKTLLKDSDGDGFGDSLETRMTTNPLLKCGLNAWPVDLNNDKAVNLVDVALLTKYLDTAHDKLTPNSSGLYYKVRYDLNHDGKVDVTDQQKVASLVGQRCS